MGIGEWRVGWWASGLVDWWTGKCHYLHVPRFFAGAQNDGAGREGKHVTLTINSSPEGRYHNPRAEGPSNLRTFARFAGVKPKNPFFTTLLHNLPPSGGHNLRPLGPSTLTPSVSNRNSQKSNI